MNDKFKDELDYKINIINTALDGCINNQNEYLKCVTNPMQYSLKAPGKRIRPIILLETFSGFTKTNGYNNQDAMAFALALECIHTSSLIHDDLPALDNDDYRRGQLTTHKKFGEDMAILAGDALINYGFEICINQLEYTNNISAYKNALKEFGRHTGIYGMLGGQSYDVYKTGQALTKQELGFIHKYKTGALIEASFVLGGLLANVNEEVINKLKIIGSNIGLAFQIRDDILDTISTIKELGKPVGSDAKNNKTTYPTIFGMDVSQGEVNRLSNEAIILLKEINLQNEFLDNLIENLIKRKK